jgi:small nuclear ribonucleoprotein (snRNP)-like protein
MYHHRPFTRKQPFTTQRRSPIEFYEEPAIAQDLVHPDHTGAEAEYLQSLVDSHKKVTVKLIHGETLQGHIRYYDQDCFSIGLSGTGPRIFLRKSSVAYISEE